MVLEHNVPRCAGDVEFCNEVGIYPHQSVVINDRMDEPVVLCVKRYNTASAFSASATFTPCHARFPKGLVSLSVAVFGKFCSRAS